MLRTLMTPKNLRLAVPVIATSDAVNTIRYFEPDGYLLKVAVSQGGGR
jgi:hypothetical protein